MVFAKVPLLLAAWYYFVRMHNPPHTAQSGEVLKVGWYQHLVSKAFPMTQQIVASVFCLAEVATLLSSRYPNSHLSKHILTLSVNGVALPSPALTAPFIAGSIATIAASILRLHCFRTLGRHFTFQLSVRDGHKLVTRGPYSIVRHPGYTTGFTAILGMSAVLASPGSWARSCEWLHLPAGGKVLAGAWALSSAYIFVVIKSRMNAEDTFLREYFGEEWEAYARRVPYQLVPPIF
ncbi:hypothetical protein CONPUDRAFT_166731 [Coniophora puteana RWD-64-598 SS2]|uniref:Protein-S-isoprenylcysteine O-methyltransferase n=1 Tax=Coniophora puteana (strain RWD-64-598) TaxID=741705 RepID=A0A5M3MJ64_CONPW|nr:uncharacterized protein CONPUDRAFT_166731 [Coniophora puteana RWD-64-598 SS2]EIW78834.1 hypothetical protein CONPUDRAFT_166731 [Coniophora puteana RWD-64-598 SS2]